MIYHDQTLISEEVIEKEFVCNLNACKGACCVEGEYGAPLELDEIDAIQNSLEAIKPYLSKEGLKYIEQNGFTEIDCDNEFVTACLPKGDCVFVIKESGINKCGIEKAHLNGKTEFKKPISCHLYPIRLSNIGDYTALNYNRWNICSPACDMGKKFGVPIYQFVQEALIRKFGKEWYSEMEEMAIEYKNAQNEDDFFEK